MGVSLYIVFYNKLLRPNKSRFISLFFVFFVYLFAGAYFHMIINQRIELENRKSLEIYVNNFFDKNQCLDRDEANEFIQKYLWAVDHGISFGVNKFIHSNYILSF